MIVTHKIKIELLRLGISPTVSVMQADENSRVLEITLNANGSAWEIPDGVSFSIAYKKPDGTKGLYDTLPNGSNAFTVAGNTVSVVIAPQMLTVPGTVTASVVISDGEHRVNTFPIIVNVIQNPAVGAVESEDYYYSSVIGNLEDLKTENKSSLVAAINEIFSTGGSGSDSGQNVELDTTLTQSGKAADAKAVGDALDDLEEKIPSIEGLAKSEDIPKVPNWAMQASKPTYTASEVGALPNTYTPPNQTAEQVGADPKGTAASAVSQHNTADESHGDIRLELKAINDRLTAFFDSDNQTLDELSEIVAYITSNKSLIDAITTSKVSVADIINNLTTNVANKPLSAAQGVALKGLIDGLTSGKLDASALSTAINTALAQANASGEFNGTSVTVKSVSESTADGGSNVVTFSDGKTLTIKNGSKGTTGGKGDTGATGQRGTGLLAVTTAPSSYTTAVGGITPKYRMALSTIKTQAGVTEVLLGDTVRYSYYHYPIAYLDSSYAYCTTRVSIRGATGAEGAAGADGADYVLTEADKSEIAALVIEMLGGNPIFGVVDENNNIVVSGDLPDGTYSVKYEMENGSKVNIGNLVIDTNVYYTVTNTLTQCTTNNSATQAVQGGSYSATITAKSGYELKSIVVKMGGTDISSTAVSGGKITISNVTGNIVITAVAEEIKAAYTNLANPASSEWGTNKRLGSDGTFRDETGTTVTNYIPIYAGQTIYIKGMDITVKSCGIYSDTKAVQSVNKLTSQTLYFKDISATTTGGQATWSYASGGTAAKPWYVRIGGVLNGTANDVIITINEPIV